MREMQKRLFHESSPADILTLHCSCQLRAMLEGFFTHFEVLAQSFGSSFELFHHEHFFKFQLASYCSSNNYSHQ